MPYLYRTEPYDSLGTVDFDRRTSMKRMKHQLRSELCQTVELRILESTVVTSVPHGRGAGLIDALAEAASPRLAQRRLAVLDSRRLGTGSSMFDYDPSEALSLVPSPL
ncbi:unannotated protein [freshwater metagenome]|uniref:Unannotated protein n=1 Tax=freshwater metagenome TaxID=449393 RepID=A0A6J6S062_9ZZZZ|nr:hypothetical protein [Actinomycetota bacterium]MSY78127.1 hypothetical protein [Actinomycetota bacterium]